MCKLLPRRALSNARVLCSYAKILANATRLPATPGTVNTIVADYIARHTPITVNTDGRITNCMAQSTPSGLCNGPTGAQAAATSGAAPASCGCTLFVTAGLWLVSSLLLA